MRIIKQKINRPRSLFVGLLGDRGIGRTRYCALFFFNFAFLEGLSLGLLRLEVVAWLAGLPDKLCAAGRKSAELRFN